MTRKSERIRKNTEPLQYTHLTFSEKMRKCRRKKRRQEKKKKSDRNLKVKAKAAKEVFKKLRNRKK